MTSMDCLEIECRVRTEGWSTQPLHSAHTAPAQRPHSPCTAPTQPLHSAHTAPAQRPHSPGTASTQPLHSVHRGGGGLGNGTVLHTCRCTTAMRGSASLPIVRSAAGEGASAVPLMVGHTSHTKAPSQARGSMARMSLWAMSYVPRAPLCATFSRLDPWSKRWSGPSLYNCSQTLIGSASSNRYTAVVCPQN